MPTETNAPAVKVILLQDDIDRHGEGCDCGLCDALGKSYGVGIYRLDKPGEVHERAYGPSEAAALVAARAICSREGLEEDLDPFEDLVDSLRG